MSLERGREGLEADASAANPNPVDQKTCNYCGGEFDPAESYVWTQLHEEGCDPIGLPCEKFSAKFHLGCAEELSHDPAGLVRRAPSREPDPGAPGGQ